MTRPLLTKRAVAPLRAGVSSSAHSANTPDGRFAGYASLFGEADDQGDIVSSGAFSAALARRATSRIALLYQHDMARPVGTWMSLREDERGLWAEGQFAMQSAAGHEAHALLKAGALTGLSIGFHAVRATRRPGGGRVLHEIDLWEISLVTFPMLEAARVSHVKAAPQTAFSQMQSTALARAMRRASAALASPDLTGKGATDA